jgi:hypothetical protein
MNDDEYYTSRAEELRAVAANLRRETANDVVLIPLTCAEADMMPAGDTQVRDVSGGRVFEHLDAEGHLLVATFYPERGSFDHFHYTDPRVGHDAPAWAEVSWS